MNVAVRSQISLKEAVKKLLDSEREDHPQSFKDEFKILRDCLDGKEPPKEEIAIGETIEFKIFQRKYGLTYNEALEIVTYAKEENISLKEAVRRFEII